ncbi:MAG: transposase [Candidatus Tectomicrobia bacterium]|nr:transposase [Candidatus Tectomicrobia bacterium]
MRSDSGFFDQKLFRLCEDLGIGYVCVGRLFDGLKERLAGLDPSAWRHYQNRSQAWDYVEVADRRGSWRRIRRALYCRPRYDGAQLLLEFARPETLLYTNLGQEQVIDAHLKDAGLASWTAAEQVIELAHGRGRDELARRALKDFASETLPFLRFAPNAAFYATMLLAFALSEAFKEDVTAPVVPVTAYPTTLRRTLIDIAAKIVRRGGRIILKVTPAAWQRLRIADLWRRSGSPPRFAWTT